MSINEEPLTPEEELLRRRTAAHQGEEWVGSVPEDSPGKDSGR